jgi:hypothetical protein
LICGPVVDFDLAGRIIDAVYRYFSIGNQFHNFKTEGRAKKTRPLREGGVERRTDYGEVVKVPVMKDAGR